MPAGTAPGTGFFGLNQFNADQEVFYVMDDAWNREYQFYPDSRDSTERGLGVQVNVRLFQWSQALAKDILFMQYEVTNTGTTSYTYNMNDNPIFFRWIYRCKPLRIRGFG